MLNRKNEDYNIMAVDDEFDFLIGIEAQFSERDDEGYGYNINTFSNSIEALDELFLNKGKYDMLLLDFELDHGDATDFVKKLREFDKDIYILLLTGKAKSPALELMTKLNIQGFCSKMTMRENNQLLVQVYSALKSVDMMNTIKIVRDGFKKILESFSKIDGYHNLDILTSTILQQLMKLVYCEDSFILIDKDILEGNEFIKGVGKYNVEMKDNILLNRAEILVKLGQMRMNSIDKVTILSDAIIIKISDIADGKDIGWIWMDFDFEKINVGSEDFASIIELLKVYSNQAALAISNSIAFSKCNNQMVQNRLQRDTLETHIRGVIDSLRRAVDAKNEYTKGHSDRVSEYSVWIGEYGYGFNRENLEILKMAGWFHDVGKIGVSEDILIKPGKLTDAEYIEIKKHPEEGVYILSAIDVFKSILNTVRHHHERLDGSGYPYGLSEENLKHDIITQIVSITDCYDAMTSGRAYQSMMTPKQAVEDLIAKSNKKYKEKPFQNENGIIEAYWYDREIVNNFIKVLINKGYLKSDENDNIQDTGKLHPTIEKALKESN